MNTLFTQDATPAFRDSPIGIIVEQNAREGTGGYHRTEVDGLAIIITAVLAVSFAALACWLWWSHASRANSSVTAARRVARRLGLSRSQVSAVQAAADSARVEPAAMLLSTAVFDNTVRQAAAGTADHDALASARQRLSKAFGTS